MINLILFSIVNLQEQFLSLEWSTWPLGHLHVPFFSALTKQVNSQPAAAQIISKKEKA